VYHTKNDKDFFTTVCCVIFILLYFRIYLLNLLCITAALPAYAEWIYVLF